MGFKVVCVGACQGADIFAWQGRVARPTRYSGRRIRYTKQPCSFPAGQGVESQHSRKWLLGARVHKGVDTRYSRAAHGCDADCASNIEQSGTGLSHVRTNQRASVNRGSIKTGHVDICVLVSLRPQRPVLRLLSSSVQHLPVDLVHAHLHDDEAGGRGVVGHEAGSAVVCQLQGRGSSGV